MAARSEALLHRRQGDAELLIVRRLDAGYGDRQVLFGVDMDIREGQIVALLGTNGAGKSTLLKSISGVVEADGGAIVLDGRDITHAPPNEIAALGIAQVPGGAGVFGSLTVAENLQLAGWTQRRDADGVRAATESVLEMFPVLRDRSNVAAADLSGGQQQMLAVVHGLHRPPAGAAHRRAVARPGAGGRRPAAAGRAAAGGRRCRGRPGRAERQRRPDDRRPGVLHGARDDPLQRRDGGSARSAGPPALGVPQRGGRAVRRRARRARRRPRRPERPRADPPLRRHPCGRRGDVRRPRAGDRRRHRTQRGGEDDHVRPRVRVHPGRRRADPARRARHHLGQPVGACRGRTRSQLPGRPAVPGDDGARDAGGGDRALGRQPQRRRCRDAAADGVRRRGAHEATGRGADGAARSDVASARRSSASCRPAPAACSTSPARSPTVRR